MSNSWKESYERMEQTQRSLLEVKGCLHDVMLESKCGDSDFNAAKRAMNYLNVLDESMTEFINAAKAASKLKENKNEQDQVSCRIYRQ